MAKKKVISKQKMDLFQIIDGFFEKRLSLFFSLSIILTAILGLYLFDLRISEGGDDSGYIENAKRFMDGIAYPGFHGTFYSIFLSWVMRIVGFKVAVFKFTSYLFILGHLILFYYAFRKRVSATILVLTMLLTSVSAELLYFGSQTYTEAMFLFMQSALFILIIRYYNEMKDQLKMLKENWWVILLVGLLLFAMASTRNIGIVALGVVLLYLLTEKKFYLAGYTLGSFLLFRIPFSIYKSLRWNIHGDDMSTQLQGLLLKNFYNPAMGKEDFAGMVERFLGNSKIYLSRLLLTGSGIKDPSYTGSSAFITVLIYLLFAVALFFAIKNSRVMRLIGYYLGITLFVTFIILQQQWGQIRLVIIYVPIIMLFITWGLFELANALNFRWLKPIIVLLLLILFFRQFSFSVKEAQEHKDELMKNLKGNKYYGYTPDWVNFLKMSEWAAKNVPKESKIASRKPSMSFIYGDGRSFYGMYRFPSISADSAIQRMMLKDGSPVIINEKELKSLGLDPQLEYGMKRDVEAFISNGDTMYSVYYFSELTRPVYLAALDQRNLHYETDLSFLQIKITASGVPGIAVVPDSLIVLLLRNNVDYMIRANLRMDPSQKTDRVINTVHRYMYFMEQKYMGIFSQESQVGANNDEPAYLFKINWERFGLESEK